MLLPQIDPDLIREFSFSWDVVLRTLPCLERSPFPINEIMHVEKVSKVQRAATIISLTSKKPNRHLKRGQTKLLIPIAHPELLFCSFPISVHGTSILPGAQIKNLVVLADFSRCFVFVSQPTSSVSVNPISFTFQIFLTPLLPSRGCRSWATLACIIAIIWHLLPVWFSLLYLLAPNLLIYLQSLFVPSLKNVSSTTEEDCLFCSLVHPLCLE